MENLKDIITQHSIRGALRENAELSKTNWFRVGGKAQWLFKPADTEDLAAFMRVKPADLAVTVLGVGSNLIVRDGGIDGVVIKLGRGFAGCALSGVSRQEDALPPVSLRSIALPPQGGESEPIRHDERTEGGDENNIDLSLPPTKFSNENSIPPQGESILSVGAGCLDLNVALFAADNGIAGLEFLSGIPGTIGGALRMNAGAYGCEIKDVLISAQVVTREGEIKEVQVEELGYSYRHCSAPKEWIFTGAIFGADRGEKEAIHARIHEIQAQREATQPIRARTGGSSFANPSAQTDKKAWQLIDEAGCRGLQIGGAQMSTKHCNFMLNLGDASAHDLEALGEEVRARVKAHSGVELTWEIQRIGKP